MVGEIRVFCLWAVVWALDPCFGFFLVGPDVWAFCCNISVGLVPLLLKI